MYALLLPAAVLMAEPKTYECRRAAGPVAVDGRLDDAAWSNAAWTDDFADIEGGLKPRPRFRTRLKTNRIALGARRGISGKSPGCAARCGCMAH